MTDSEKLDLILSEMQELKQRTANIEKDVIMWNLNNGMGDKNN